VDALLAAWAAERNVADAVAELGLVSVPAAPVRSYAEAAADPHVRARDMLQEVARPDAARVPVTGPAAKLSRTPLAVRRPAPALGADGEAILRELGVDAAERSALVDAGVVALP
jgi:formyl-CoA transferase